MPIPGGVQVGGFISPSSTGDSYPVTDPTYGLGGLRTVGSTAERDAIPNPRREEGMIVFVTDNSTYYGLSGGIANGDWTVLPLGDLTSGADGATGATGTTGATGATGATGPGFTGATIDNGDLKIIYVNSSGISQNVNLGRVVGPTGADGTDGTDGATGATGTIGKITDFIKATIDGGFTLGFAGLTGIDTAVGISAGVPTVKIGEIGWQRGGETFPETVGGVEAGSSYDNGTSIATILEDLLFPYQAVSFASFGVGLASNLYEVGQTAGETSKSVTWTTSGPDANWVAGSVGVEISDGYGTLMSGQDYDDSPVSVTHPGYNFSSKDTLTFTISGQQDQGADPSRNTSIYWRNRYYYGRTGDGFTGPGLTGQGFEDDISVSRTSANGYTVTFDNISPSTNFGYILLPTADYSGTPVFRDQSTGFGWPFTLEATYTHTNAYGLGVEYGIWKTTNAFGGTLEIGVEV